MKTISRRLPRFLLAQLLLVAPMAAQNFTTVTGTVTDPNGVPYANGTVSAQLITAGVTPTLGGSSFSMSAGPTPLSGTGSFLMQLASNTAMVPSTLKWKFTVCSAGGTIQPAGGTGPQCFTALITITGAAQSVSAALSAVAPALAAAIAVATGVAANGQTIVALPTGITETCAGANGCIIADSAGDSCQMVAGTYSCTIAGTLFSMAAGNTFLLGSGGTQIELANGIIENITGITGTGNYSTSTGTISAARYGLASSCLVVGTAANPSVAGCAIAVGGLFSCATAASGGSCRVQTTQVDTTSIILLNQRSDTVAGTLIGVTCNTTASTIPVGQITAVVSGTSFTFPLGTFSTNPECFNYLIVN